MRHAASAAYPSEKEEKAEERGVGGDARSALANKRTAPVNEGNLQPKWFRNYAVALHQRVAQRAHKPPLRYGLVVVA
jgi:hypothetical protein